MIKILKRTVTPTNEEVRDSFTTMNIIPLIPILVCLSGHMTLAFDLCQPCHCINKVIACDNKGLHNVPVTTFRALPNARSYHTLDLSHNSLSSGPRDAFANLAIRKLLLNANNLTNMDVNAFLSIKDNLTELSIADNKFRTTPTALQRLKVLVNLDMRNNPIVGSEFDEDIFRHLGSTLQEFHFGSPSVTEWPRALTHLPRLEVLDFDGSKLQWLPFTAFHGYEYTLKNLTIRNTELYQIPQAISSLANLDTLNFDNNIRVGDHGILASAFTDPGDVTDTSQIKHLSLKNDSLTTMPSVLRKLIRLQSLALDHNQMWYISDTAISNIQSPDLSSLSLRDCNLDRIPHSLLKLNSLRSIDLAVNEIRSIDVDDLNHHRGLVRLDLSDNPVEYISENAFKAMPNITEISFAGSGLKQLPRALVNAKDSLNLVNLERCDIECTCDLAWFLGRMDFNRTTIAGDCETIERAISDYIIHRVPRCPT